MKTFPTLYTTASTGAIQEWTIEVDGGQYRTHAGKYGGKITTSEWTKAEPTNVGRANGRDSSEQAEFEALARWNKKYEKGGKEPLEGLDEAKFESPMLAQTYEAGKTKVTWPLLSQPKLDGLRAIITRHGAFSRTGKPWLTIPHILKAVQPIFDEYPDMVLDGELYNHELKDDFNEICSVVKRTKPTEADIAKSARMAQFWWYDICDTEMANIARVGFIGRVCGKLCSSTGPVVLVPTSIINSDAEALTHHKAYVGMGFEGQMLRDPEAEYQHKRSKALLKHKEFQDQEYEIVEILEGLGNKSQMAGSMTLRHPDGRTFNSNIAGTHEFMKEIWAYKDSYVGKWATCVFFNLTPAGIPRFPYVKAIRDGVGID